MPFPDLTSTLAHHYSDDRSSSQDPLKLLLVWLDLEESILPGPCKRWLPFVSSACRGWPTNKARVFARNKWVRRAAVLPAQLSQGCADRKADAVLERLHSPDKAVLDKGTVPALTNGADLQSCSKHPGFNKVSLKWEMLQGCKEVNLQQVLTGRLVMQLTHNSAAQPRKKESRDCCLFWLLS